MKNILIAAAALFGALTFSAIDGAQAAQGCGPGAIRGPRGFCRAVVGPPVYAPRRVVRPYVRRPFYR